jgi:hypothetical protein
MKDNFAYGSILLKLSYEGLDMPRYGAPVAAIAKMCQNRDMRTLLCLNNAISHGLHILLHPLQDENDFISWP